MPQPRLCGSASCRATNLLPIPDEVGQGGVILLADRIYPMTPGPDAVLGPPIEVGLPRPRQRRHMSLEPAYQKARRALVEFLRACRNGAGSLLQQATLDGSGLELR